MNKLYIITLLLLASFSFGQNKAGINTDDPKATLDVNGNVIIGQVEDYTNGNLELMWNPDDKRVVGLPRIAPISKLNFKITCMPNQDWIDDFNTKIPTSEYTLIVINASLKYPEYEATPGSQHPNNSGDWYRDWGTFYGISHLGDNVTDGNPVQTVNPDQVVQAFSVVEDDYWHLRADYPSAKPELAINIRNNSNSRQNFTLYWDIDVLAVHNSYVDDQSKGTISSQQYPNWPTSSNNFVGAVAPDDPVIIRILNSAK